MRLSKRIYAIADQIESGESVADIGTDHGYVPMLLIKNGISPRAIMSDISDGSLSKAKETFSLCCLDVPAEDFRVGDGLDTIEAGEADVIIIAGLGGHTIADILDADIGKSRSFSKLVLQPRKHSGTLRYYLYTRGWDIESEVLAAEGKFACEIISAVPVADVKTGDFRTAPYPEDDIRWKYPESLCETDPVLALNRIGWKSGSIKEQIQNLKQSSRDNSILICRLSSDLEYLENLAAIIKEKCAEI
jgi:tRNA (adenine22-N1)-methyltransferase